MLPPIVPVFDGERLWLADAFLAVTRTRTSGEACKVVIHADGKGLAEVATELGLSPG